MFGKKSTAKYTIEAATAELDDILARATEAFLSSDRVDLLESRVASIRARQAAAYSVAANVTHIGGDGGLRDRLRAVIRE
jgi:hypothetical protein